MSHEHFTESRPGGRGPLDTLEAAEDPPVPARTALQHVDSLTALLLEERRGRESAEQAGRHAAFLAEASGLLAASLEDYAGLLAGLARVAVPFLADWCLVRLVRDGMEATVALAHADPSKEGLLAPFDVGSLDVAAKEGESCLVDPGASVVVNAGEHCPARFVERFPGLTGPRREQVLSAAHAAGMTSFMAVSLAARGRTSGALILVGVDGARRYGPEHVALAEALAARAALALDNARLYRDAQRAARTREDFLMLASHELRTPLTSLQIAVQALLRRARVAGVAERPPAWSVPLLGAVERSAVRLGALVDDLLDFSSLAADPPAPLPQEVDLRAVVAEVVERSTDTLRRAGCAVTWTADGPTDGSWDPRWLAQIVTHLLSNAVKYGRGAPIEIGLAGGDEAVRLTVRDHGKGVPAEEQARIFEKFEQTAPAHQPYGGLGLGLWLVRRMVVGLGGTVTVESRPGEGAAFSVELPRHRASGEVKSAAAG